MNFKELDLCAWGWYFDDDTRISAASDDFLKFLLSISLKYGLNMSTYGHLVGLNRIDDCNELASSILEKVDEHDGCKLLMAINFNFYSKELSSHVLPSLVLTQRGSSMEFVQHKDIDSKLFGTLREKKKFHCFFYKMATDAFVQDDVILCLANTARLNSYIRDLHKLMELFHLSRFEFSPGFCEDPFGFSDDGYILYEDELLFYEDTYQLLPAGARYELYEQIDLPFL